MPRGIIENEAQLRAYWKRDRGATEARLMRSGEVVGTVIAIGPAAMIVQKVGRPNPEPIPWDFFTKGGYAVVVDA